MVSAADACTPQGDDCKDWMWDGPEDSDEEIEDMIPLKNKYEKEVGLKFSKNGIIEFIEKFLARESHLN